MIKKNRKTIGIVLMVVIFLYIKKKYKTPVFPHNIHMTQYMENTMRKQEEYHTL